MMMKMHTAQVGADDVLVRESEFHEKFRLISVHQMTNDLFVLFSSNSTHSSICRTMYGFEIEMADSPCRSARIGVCKNQ